MNKTIGGILFWVPRSLGIMFAVFISLFSLDVLEMGAGFWITLAGFLVHNIPTILLIVALVAGWRREWIGAAGFLLVAGWFLSLASPGDWLFGLFFIGTPLLVMVFFLAGWAWKRKIQAAQGEKKPV